MEIFGSSVVEFVAKIFRPVHFWGGVVKFSHTVFAMPFALSMFLIVSKFDPVSGSQLFWILIALIGARTAAMAYNRLADRDLDERNPRTRNRELPSGAVRPWSVSLLLALSSGVFLISAAMLGRHCLVLAPFVLGVLFFYSHTKRFTCYSHLVLGLALALAPGGVWYALTGRIELLPMYLMAAVLFWVAGFDTLYACQDVDFDRAVGLHSLPASFGVSGALSLARLFHGIAALLLIAFGFCADMGVYYFLGVSLFALMLMSQHRLLSSDDLSRMNSAFFTRNGAASFLFFFGVLLDLLF